MRRLNGFGLAAFGLVAACAAVPVAETQRHASSGAMVLSRAEIDANFVRAEAAPLLRTAAAPQPGPASRHEVETLVPAHESGAVRPRRVDLQLPQGWTGQSSGAVRHGASGLVCEDAYDFRNEGETDSRVYTLVKVAQFDDKGLDVGCNYEGPDKQAITLYASYWPDITLEESVAMAVRAIMQRFAVKKELPVIIMTAEGEPSDPHADDLKNVIAGGFDVGEISGVPFKTSLWLAKTYGWHVKARATYPQEDMDTELVAAIAFMMSLHAVHKKNAADPVSAAEV